MEKAKDLKTKMAQQLGSRKELNNTDIKDILSGFADKWVDQLPALQAAMNSKNRDSRTEG